MKPDNATIRFLRSADAPQWRGFRDRVLLPMMAVVVWALLVPASMVAQQAKPSEYQVKAAYIYNFGKFVKWPAASAATRTGAFTICVLGEDPFGSVLQSTLAGKLLDGKPVAIKRLQKPPDVAGCHILFIDSAQERNLRAILAAAKEASVLTVSDMPDFSKRGGMIQFVLIGDRVRFEINVASTESASLVLASDLLKVAAAVRRSAESGG
jgi:hypothetical protein